MAILCGIEAVVSVKKGFAREYQDRGQNKVSTPPAEPKAANKVSNFIPYRVSSGLPFAIHCTLQPDFDLNSEYLAFLVSINGENVSFTFHEISSLKHEKLKVICRLSKWRKWLVLNAEENRIDMSIFKMKKPVLHRSCVEPLIEGEISCEDDKNLGRVVGNHRIYHGQKGYEIAFKDVLDEFPIALFTWKYSRRSFLQDLLIVPRTPELPFRILGCVSRFPNVEPSVAASPWARLIGGIRLSQLDQMAFEILRGPTDIKNLGIQEVEELASKHDKNQDISRLPIDDVYVYAKTYLDDEISNKIHTRTLRILAEANFRDSVDGGHDMNAESVAGELKNFSDGELQDMAGEQDACEELVRKMPIHLVKTHAQDHLPDADISTMSIFDAKKYASKGVMERRYHVAQVQAVAAVVGEFLLQRQQRQERPVGAPAADAHRQESRSRSSGVRIKQEAPAAAVLAEASSSGNSRKRTRSQANQTAEVAEGSAKRTRSQADRPAEVAEGSVKRSASGRARATR